MSALSSPHITLLADAQDEDRHNGTEPIERCRFCECTDDSPCSIQLREDDRGVFHLSRHVEETTLILPCDWFMPGICTNPFCMEKLLLESRNRVVLFDARGDRTG